MSYQEVYRTTYYPEHGLSGKRYRDTVDWLLVKQDGRCAICNLRFYVDIDPHSRFHSPVKPNLDHCHHTGMIRGLLCDSCNASMNAYEKYHILYQPDYMIQNALSYIDEYWSLGIMVPNIHFDIMQGYHIRYTDGVEGGRLTSLVKNYRDISSNKWRHIR